MTLFVGTAEVFRTASDRDPAVQYTVVVGDETATCTCPAFRYHPEKVCKHLSRVLAWSYPHQQPQQSTGPLAPGEDLVKLLSQSFDAGMRLGVKVGKAQR